MTESKFGGAEHLVPLNSSSKETVARMSFAIFAMMSAMSPYVGWSGHSVAVDRRKYPELRDSC